MSPPMQPNEICGWGGASQGDLGMVHAFISTLEAILPPHAKFVERPPLAGRGASRPVVLDAILADGSMTLVLTTKTVVFPRDVRDEVRQFRADETTLRGDKSVLSVLLADVISPGARLDLRANGIAYFDRSGSLFLPIAGAFIYVECASSKTALPFSDAIFFGCKAQVLLTVFAQRAHWVSVKEIADASGVSAGTVSQTLMELERRGWMRSRGGGPSKLRRLTDAPGLIGAWSHYLQHEPPRLQRYNVPVAIADIPRHLAEACDRRQAPYVITGDAAAHMYSPAFRGCSQVVCRMAPNPATKDVLASLDARSSTQEWNLGVIETGARAHLYGSVNIDGVQLAPALQVYLDISPNSDRESLEHFRQVYLQI